MVVAACTFTIVGDTFAAIFGANIKSPRIFRKTLLGSLGFLVSSVAVAFFLHNLKGSLSMHALIIGAVVAMIFEALPLPWDDNFSVPIICGAVMSFV